MSSVVKKAWFLLTAIFALAVLVPMLVVKDQRSRGRSTSERAVQAGLSNLARSELEAYLASKSATLASIPSHPLSEDVLQDVVTIYRHDLRVDQAEAEKMIAEHFRDSNLGLYALKRYLSAPTGEPDGTGTSDPKTLYCQHLCEDYPNARASSMAFDHLTQYAPDKLDLCDRYINMHPDSRLAVFALIRKGETYQDEGQAAEAALCYLEAWQKEPARGKRVSNALNDIWSARGHWFYPVLMPEDYLESQTLSPIKERILSGTRAVCEAGAGDVANAPERLWNSGGNREVLEEILNDERTPVIWRAKAGLVLAKSLLDRRKTAEAIAVFQEVHKLLSEKGRSTPECVDLAMAVFLLKDALSNGTSQLESLDRSLELVARQADVSRIREAFLELARGSFDLISADEQAYYTCLIAQRHLEVPDVVKAMETLKAGAEIEGVSPHRRKEIVLELARVYADEWGAHLQAAKICAEFCPNLATTDARRDVRYAAARYYFRAAAYDEAILQFRELLAEPGDDGANAVAGFMIAFCHLKKGDNTGAIRLFHDFVAKYPDSVLSSRALYVEGVCHLSSQHYDDAIRCFQELSERYPESEYAERAKDYVARLANMGAEK